MIDYIIIMRDLSDGLCKVVDDRFTSDLPERLIKGGVGWWCLDPIIPREDYSGIVEFGQP